MANTAKTAIVTGASQGIGAGLVGAFLKRGYSVVANSRHITKANPFPAAANVALVDGDIGAGVHEGREPVNALTYTFNAALAKALPARESLNMFRKVIKELDRQ